MLFAALVPKADYCESPFGLAASLLTSSFLYFFPPGLLRLHCMTFFPAPLKPWVSGEPIWPEVSLSKASRHSTCHFLFGFISSSLLSPHTPPARPLRAKPSSAEASWFPLSRFYVQSLASFAINMGVQGSDSVAASAGAALLCSNCPSWWLFIILTATATWRLNRGQHSGKNLLRI